MNGAYLHLSLNHLPVVGLWIGFLLVLFALFRRSEEPRRLSLYVLVLVALTAIPAYLTGEPAEDVVRELAGVSETFIESHEESALFALIAVEIVGAVALIGVLAFRGPKQTPRWFLITVLILTAVAGASIVRTANLGGQIRHSEIRADSAASMQGTEAGEGSASEDKGKQSGRDER